MKTTALMINPLQQKHLDKIDTLDCDICTLNLEDGITPSRKTEALENCIDFLTKNQHLKSKICIRVNDLPNALLEIKRLNSVKPFAIRLPKVHDADDIKQALDVLDDNIELHFSVETSSALNALSKLKLDKRVTTCYLGLLDMANSIGLSHRFLSPTNPMVHYIESKFLFDARDAGLFAFAPIYQDYKNLDGLKEWCELELSLGYTAKGAISPTQLDIIKAIFNQTDTQKASYIIKRFEEMQERGISGFVDELYGFIDEPIYKNALQSLRFA